MSGAAGPLCLFRPPEQLPSAAGVLVSRAADLVPRFVSAESAAPHVDGIRSAGEPIPTTTSSYYASALLMMCCLGVTFAKSRMRESRPYGSVRAKPNGLAPSPSCADIFPNGGAYDMDRSRTRGPCDCWREARREGDSPRRRFCPGPLLKGGRGSSCARITRSWAMKHCAWSLPTRRRSCTIRPCYPCVRAQPDAAAGR